MQRGPPEPPPALAALSRTLDWLGDVRDFFAAGSEELVEHLKTSEWFLDNFLPIQRSVRQVRQDLPRRFLRRLPALTEGPGAGLPRAYALAFALLHATEMVPDATSTRERVQDFKAETPLTTAELWALPALLRLCVLEELVLALRTVCPALPAPLPDPPLEVPRELDEDERAARCIRTLRALERVDWKAFFVHCSPVERILEGDPGGSYPRSDFETRDRCRKQVEDVAWRARAEEMDVARVAIELAAEGRSGERERHVATFLIGEGRAALERRFPGALPPLERLRRLAIAGGARTLVGGIAAATAVVLAGPVLYLARLGAGPVEWVAGLALVLIPASTLGVTVVHWILTNLLPPRVLPKLDFREGIDPGIRTLVVVPCMLGSVQEVQNLVRQLELHYLRNSDPQLDFALLTDWLDAPRETLRDDEDLLERAATAVRLLNRKHPRGSGAPFHLLHRARLWNPAEGVWMGWERKRGKLEELNELLLGSARTGLRHVVGDPAALRGVPFVITLDAGTVLPNGAAARLVGALAHPLNRPELDPATGRVVRGHGVIQPRVEIAPTATAQSRFTRIFSGDAAIDIYSLAVSDVYQDLCGQGIYVGKGIHDVAAFARSLEGRVPENALVSHDHFEGLHARAALATDVVLYEDYPPQYLVFARRMHRWVRGDWQLVPWLRRRVPWRGPGRAPTRLSPLGRWILFDNLRRSLLSPALLAMLAAAWLLFPGRPLLWTILAVLAPAGHVFTALVSGLARGPRRARVRPWLAGISHAFRQNVGRWALLLVFLAHEAVVTADAIARATYRRVVSRRRLLEWRTAEHTAQLLASRPRFLTWAEMAASPLLALGLLAAVLLLRPEAWPWAAPFLGLWIAAPEIARRISRPIAHRVAAPGEEERAHLRRIGRRTWYFFETFVGPADQWLPPDNYQEDPLGEVAHRTSPTNVGMYLVSAVAAHDLGWLGTSELLFRLRCTVDTLGRMEMHRGHVYNWYDTRTLEPLIPRYVSSVDSGNLAAALLVAQQACAEASVEPAVAARRWDGLLDAVDLLAGALRHLGNGGAGVLRCAPLLASCDGLRARTRAARDEPTEWARLLGELCDRECPRLDHALVEALRELEDSVDTRALREVRTWLERTHHHLQSLREDVGRFAPWLAPLGSAPDEVRDLARELGGALGPTRRLCDLPQACERALGALEARRASAELGPEAQAWCRGLEAALHDGEAAVRELRDHLLEFGVHAEEHVRAMDFGLFYDRESRLLHVGYDVTAGRLDPNRYDLLASEARIASFLAIAKGDVPVEHWFFLGRPVTRVRGEVALLSWGGTMFEYLMPSLFMRSGESTLLSHSCSAAIDAQIDYARRHGVPWGISESGFHQLDADRNYQYRAFGVPGLGLKRDLAEDLVIAPYASAVALELRPEAVLANLARLEELGALGVHGFYEALDFTPARAPSGERYAVVRSHMAHHQGMVLAAVDNRLQSGVLSRRFHATSYAQTADLLLHEQVPVGVSPQMHLESAVAPPAPPMPRRELAPWRPDLEGPLPDVHVLSNGRLSTGVTETGGGWLAWRGLALSPRGADPSRADHGTWLYVRDEDSGDLWSAGTAPTGVRPEEHHVIYHAHRVELQRRDRELYLRQEIAVAPREDVEVRLITLTNESRHPRRVTVCSCLEPVLAPFSKHTRHPAFSKLFIESEALPGGGLLFRRRSRSPEERKVVLVHALVPGEDVEPDGHETDRARFLGRGRGWDRPAALERSGRLSGTTGAVLDPVCALRAAVELRPGASARLAFLTCAAGSRSSALEAIGRFRSLEQIEWVFEDARASTERELHAMRLMPRLLPAIQRLTTRMLHPCAAVRCDPAEIAANRLGQQGLWGRGVSGDLPILLVELEDARAARLLSEVLLAHRWWRRCGLSFDLVVLLLAPSGYAGEDEERVARLVASSGSAEWRNRHGGIFVLHADQMGSDELRLHRVAARVVLRSAEGRLAEQLAARAPTVDSPPRFVPGFAVEETAEPTPPLDPPGERRLANDLGGFSADGCIYEIDVGEGRPTPAPWCNVIANPDFGCLVSESCLGTTWSLNASERRLTPWRNDPVSDDPSEVVYLRDEETGLAWTPTPLPFGRGGTCRVRHGAGWTEYRRRSEGLDQTLTVRVPRRDPVKVVSLRLRNLWSRPRRLTATYYAELVLGGQRADSAPFVVCEYDDETGALLARNVWNPEHAERVAFLASDVHSHGVTADRGEFLGREGGLARPRALERWGLSGAVQAGADPCHALMLHVELEPEEERTVHFLLGDGADRAHALELVRRYRDEEQRAAAWTELGAFWDGLLGAVEVATPEPAMDLALNRWLLYQSVASRLEARVGPYQSSGAFGFRDQLQDVMALVHGAPERARDHLLAAAARQFAAGDVLHWWHPPGARGVRTRCSDDLLWLPYVACHYVLATGDAAILDAEVPFLTGDPLGPKELERYGEYAVGPETATLLEHCRRALRRGVTSGEHGLPLIGTCDWNDGFDRVGPGGAGESVWLAWFSVAAMDAFAAVLKRLGRADEAARWAGRARELGRVADTAAWDGAWYVRAWFDDGTPLGSSVSTEARIDLIAQAWAAFSGAADPERARVALASAERLLAPSSERLVRLLDPPFDRGPQDPGYIRAYPPGVRENGGQYTHAATWLGWAHAALGDGAAAEHTFRRLNPLAGGRSAAEIARYRVEPYVVAADVYAGAHGGRGGWTWYTGAAAWLWRLGVEGVLGLRRVGGDLRVEPCIPPQWDGFRATVRTTSCVCSVVVENPDGTGHGVARVWLDGEELPDGRVPLASLAGRHEVRVTLGTAAASTRAAPDA